MSLSSELSTIRTSKGIDGVALGLITTAGLFNIGIFQSASSYGAHTDSFCALTAEVGGVSVHAIEIRGSLDDLPFLGGKFRKTLPQHLFHVWRVEPEIDWVGKPPDGRIEMVLCGSDI